VDEENGSLSPGQFWERFVILAWGLTERGKTIHPSRGCSSQASSSTWQASDSPDISMVKAIEVVSNMVF